MIDPRGPRLRQLRQVAALFVVASCDGSATAPASGRLAIAFDALPETGTPTVAVSGPGGLSLVVTAADTLDDLARGTYTIVASEVVGEGSRYTATPAHQAVDVAPGRVASATPIAYAIASARLAVSVLGLPPDAEGSVTVAGPNGFTRTIAATTMLELLDPGTYSIGASDVESHGRTYRASPATQTISLATAAAASTVSVWYGAGNSVLDIAIAGLPMETRAAVTVTGPGGVVRTLTSATTLAYLDAGTYTITAGVVGRELITYDPETTSQTVALQDGATVVANVTYAGRPLELGLELVATGLVSPVLLTAPDDDARLFIVERFGRVLVAKEGEVVSTPFLDIRARVNASGERGLLGMAFDPAYATTGLFYVYYLDVRGDLVLERFGSTPGEDIAGPSHGVVMTIAHRGSEHHGGTIAFGPDGMLYLAPGDGGCCGDPNDNAQNLSNLLGKVLRIDVRTIPYAIPPNNPFVGRVGYRPEIWAYGLRNPWRFSFDPPSGLLFIGDVGQDAREEVNVSPSAVGGLNYGWRRMEGTACFNPTFNCNPAQALKPPIHDYSHAEGCSVTGGYVYRGTAIPELTGHYLYSDYCRGWLRSFRATSGGAASHRSWPGISLPQTVSFGRDGSGELYMVAEGMVWRIVRR